jgi:hypothetical protein
MIERRLAAIQRLLLAVSCPSNLLDLGQMNVRYWKEQTFNLVGCLLTTPKPTLGYYGYEGPLLTQSGPWSISL